MAELNTTETPEVVPAAEVAAAPVVETPELSPRLKALQDLGYQDLKDENEAFDRLLASHKQLKTEFTAQLQGALAELKQSQPTSEFAVPVQEAPKPSGSEFAFQVPKIDKREVALWRQGDGWKDGTPEAIKQQFAGYTQARDRFAENLLDDFEGTIDPVIQKKVAQLVEQKLGQITHAQQAQTFQQKLFSDNPWLFENDPVSGKPSQSLSAEGQLIDRYMAEAMTPDAMGCAMNYQQAWNYANALHSASKSAQASKQATTAQTAQEINEQKKREALLRGGGTPNRTGSLPTASDSRSSQRNKALRPGERFVQIAKRDGLAIS